MKWPLLLDLFCGAGGAAMGYHRAGFDVVGVDIKPQPHYPFPFVRADALAPPVDLSSFDAVHASPPCQRYSIITRQHRNEARHPDLVPPTRAMLRKLSVPWVMENVEGSPLLRQATFEVPEAAGIRLCGSGMGLGVRRHRLFETNWPLTGLACRHELQSANPHRLRSGYVPGPNPVVPVYGGGQAGFPVAVARRAMGIEWMTQDELKEAIPPAYTEFIGEQLLQHIGANAWSVRSRREIR